MNSCSERLLNIALEAESLAKQLGSTHQAYSYLMASSEYYWKRASVASWYYGEEEK